MCVCETHRQAGSVCVCVCKMRRKKKSREKEQGKRATVEGGDEFQYKWAVALPAVYRFAFLLQLAVTPCPPKIKNSKNISEFSTWLISYHCYWVKTSSIQCIYKLKLLFFFLFLSLWSSQRNVTREKRKGGKKTMWAMMFCLTAVLRLLPFLSVFDQSLWSTPCTPLSDSVRVWKVLLCSMRNWFSCYADCNQGIHEQLLLTHSYTVSIFIYALLYTWCS